MARLGVGAVHAEFWYGKLKQKYHVEDLSIGERITLSWVLEEQFVSVWAGFLCFRVPSDGLLLAR